MKVRMADSVHIPPRSEARVEGRLATTVTVPILIVPKEEMTERTPVLVARCNGLSNRQSAFAPDPAFKQRLYKDTSIASLQAFQLLLPRLCSPLTAAKKEACMVVFRTFIRNLEFHLSVNLSSPCSPSLWHRFLTFHSYVIAFTYMG